MSSALEISLLGRLLKIGLLKVAARSEVFVRRWETARWIEPTGRKGEWRIRDGMSYALEQRLTDIAPNWEVDFEFLRSIGQEPFDHHSIEAIPAFRKTRDVEGLVNRRNWNAAAGLGPKHEAKLLASATLTKDWMLRFRPCDGLKGVFGGKEIRFDEMAELLTECAIPERLWLRLDGFSGAQPRLIVTCENLGAYIDLPLPNGAVAIYAPGADIEPAGGLVKFFPEANWIHFGDVDPDGLQISESLSSIAERQTTFFVPTFADEYLPGRPVETPWRKTPDRPLFDELRRTQKRIFQEVFLLDLRLAGEISAYCD